MVETKNPALVWKSLKLEDREKLIEQTLMVPEAPRKEWARESFSQVLRHYLEPQGLLDRLLQS